MSHQRPGDAAVDHTMSSKHLEDRALDRCVPLVLRGFTPCKLGRGCQWRIRLGSSTE